MQTFRELPNGTVHTGFADVEPGDRVSVQTTSGRKIVTLGEIVADDDNGNIFEVVASNQVRAKLMKLIQPPQSRQ